MTFTRASLAVLLLSSTIISTAFADDAPNYKTDTLTGDWGGARTKLADAGIATDITYKFDIMGNTSGGIQEGVRGLDNLDVVFSIDGEKLFGSKGTTALIHLLNNNGARADGSLVGSAQGIDNIEVPRSTGKLFQAWIQQNFFDDRLSILGGLYAVDSEFYVTDSSGLFLHSAYGTGTDFAQSGTNGPAIFPFSALGTRVKIAPTKTTYVQVALMDGVAGDPTNTQGTQVELNNGDGALWVGEAGYTPEGSKIAVGGWRYTQKFPENISGDNKRSQGVYILGERKIYHEANSEKGLTVFARLGFADKDVNQFDYAWATGAVYTGLIPTRDEGQLGFGINGAHNSSSFRAANAPVDTAETALELTYSDKLTPWLSVQPDVQYIINPGTNPALDNALVIGSRFTVQF